MVQLDKAIRIPQCDSSGTQNLACPAKSRHTNQNPYSCGCNYCQANDDVYNVAHSLVTWVRDGVSTNCQNTTFDIKPIGSFSLGTKVIDCNEFDFLLIYVKENDSQNEECMQVFQEFKQFFLRLQKLVQPVIYIPEITAVYSHGPAWCVELSWTANGEVNTIGVDITLAVRHPDKEMKECCTSLKDNPIFDSLYQQINDNALYVNVDPARSGYTTCTLDTNILETLRDISPNILVAYRIIKFFISVLFPKRVKFCKNTVDGFICSNYINSHELKSCLLWHINKYYKPDHWTTAKLSKRIICMIESMKQRNEFAIDFINDGTPSREMKTFELLIESIKAGKCSEDMSTMEVPLLPKCFAYVKERNYQTVACLDEFQKLLVPYGDQSGREMLVYFPGNPLLRNTSNLEPKWTELVRYFRNYLIRKLADSPPFPKNPSFQRHDFAHTMDT